MKLAIPRFALGLLAIGLLLPFSCANFLAPTYDGPRRSFSTSFESIGDFAGFYIEAGPDFASAQELSTEQVFHGAYSHKAWVLAARAENNDGLAYTPHRAYPTIQFQNTQEGVYRTPCLVSLWVWLDMTLAERSPQIDDWMSFITLTPDASDEWSRTVLVNVGPDGYARLMHVPRQGQQEYLYQAGAENDPEGLLSFPQRQWVRFDVYIDFDRADGYAKFFQNGTLISHAEVEGGAGTLAQAHFGLYASAAVAAGTVYNDRLRIVEVADEAEAMSLVAADW